MKSGRAVTALLVGLLAAGCARATPATVSPVVPQAPAAPRVAAAADIGAQLDAVGSFLRADDLIGLDPTAISGAGDYTGTLTVTASVGRASVSSVSSVAVERAGVKESFWVTIRTASTDPARVVDVLHRSGNPERDYLLTGKAYRSVLPTEWATVPQQFGVGLGCLMPGRSVACSVVDLLEKNQTAEHALPVNSATTSGTVVTLTSGVTVRQLIGLPDWPLPTSTKALLARATEQELDRTLVGVTLTYSNSVAERKGRLTGFTVSGSFTLDGTAATARLSWTDGNDDKVVAASDALAVPTRAVYTPLTATQAKALAAIAADR